VTSAVFIAGLPAAVLALWGGRLIYGALSYGFTFAGSVRPWHYIDIMFGVGAWTLAAFTIWGSVQAFKGKRRIGLLLAPLVAAVLPIHIIVTNAFGPYVTGMDYRIAFARAFLLVPSSLLMMTRSSRHFVDSRAVPGVVDVSTKKKQIGLFLAPQVLPILLVVAGIAFVPYLSVVDWIHALPLIVLVSCLLLIMAWPSK
jgi:hypothetical protein